VTDSLAVSHHRGRVLTGFTFGKRGGGVYARVYDKTAEADADAPIREVWRASGWEQSADTVWRVEFELRPDFLRNLEAADGARLPTDPRAVLSRHLDDVWFHLASQWLVLRDRQSLRSRIERRSPEAWWEQLAVAGQLAPSCFGPPRPMARRPRKVLDCTMLHKQIAGVLAAIGAYHGNDSLMECLNGLTRWMLDHVGVQGFREAVERAERRHGLVVGTQEVAPRDAQTEADEGYWDELLHHAPTVTQYG
jgi:hypothetical protein